MKILNCLDRYSGWQIAHVILIVLAVLLAIGVARMAYSCEPNRFDVSAERAAKSIGCPTFDSVYVFWTDTVGFVCDTIFKPQAGSGYIDGPQVSEWGYYTIEFRKPILDTVVWGWFYYDKSKVIENKMYLRFQKRFIWENLYRPMRKEGD